jgi:antitoxin MazE
MTAILKRVEGGYDLHIPDDVAAQVGLTGEVQVHLGLSDGKLLLIPTGLPKYNLADLVAGITDENKHELIDFGPPVGNEVW